MSCQCLKRTGCLPTSTTNIRVINWKFSVNIIFDSMLMRPIVIFGINALLDGQVNEKKWGSDVH